MLRTMIGTLSYFDLRPLFNITLNHHKVSRVRMAIEFDNVSLYIVSLYVILHVGKNGSNFVSDSESSLESVQRNQERIFSP